MNLPLVIFCFRQLYSLPYGRLYLSRRGSPKVTENTWLGVVFLIEVWF